MAPIWRTEWPAAVLVLGVAITWGVSFAVVKATERLARRVLSVGASSWPASPCWRYDLGWCRSWTGDRGPRGVLGAVLGIGFVLCTVGMQTTSVLISAFVIGTTVVFAPLVAWIWLRRRLTTRAAAAVSLAFIGLAMITIRRVAVGPGTLLILAAAILWAAHLVALERWSRAGRLHALTLVQLAAAAAVALGCLLVFEKRRLTGRMDWLAGVSVERFDLGAVSTPLAKQIL
jgi:drug/metabolite transporter (DMT)-like permease